MTVSVERKVIKESKPYPRATAVTVERAFAMLRVYGHTGMLPARHQIEPMHLGLLGLWQERASPSYLSVYLPIYYLPTYLFIIYQNGFISFSVSYGPLLPFILLLRWPQMMPEGAPPWYLRSSFDMSFLLCERFFDYWRHKIFLVTFILSPS